jgi:hypothetical protein
MYGCRVDARPVSELATLRVHSIKRSASGVIVVTFTAIHFRMHLKVLPIKASSPPAPVGFITVKESLHGASVVRFNP